MTSITTGRDAETGRFLLLQNVQSLDQFSGDFTAPGRYFVVMLICDGTKFANNEIFDLSRRLIDAGCVYLCCWGPDCERVHDLFDTAWLDYGFDPDSSDTIMTTWHTDDSLDDFIEYAIRFAEPTEKYQMQCCSVVALVIGDQTSANKVKEVFNNPAEFLAE